jgi:DinB superfamily
MSHGPPPADRLILRLQYVTMRLGGHARGMAAGGLTDPDQPTGERWEWGQVWAHLAEFIPYWIAQVRRVAAAEGDEPVPFGRTKTDPERIDAIERDRGRPVSELWARMRSQMADLWNLIDHLPAEAWGKRGLHPTLGGMDMSSILDDFLVGHLEQHADQLDGLAAAHSSP